jgi:hypothetical protein
MKAVLDWLVTLLLSHPGEVAVAIVTVLGAVSGGGLLKTIKADRRAQLILKMAHVAFNAVEEMARLAPDNAPMAGAAKLVAFLDQLDDSLQAVGAKPLSDAEREAAKGVASAINVQKESALRSGPQVALPTA